MSITQTPDMDDLLWADPNDLTNEEIANISVAIQRRLDAVEAGRVKIRAHAVVESRLRLVFPSSWGDDVNSTSCGIS